MRTVAWLGLGLVALTPVSPERARATEPQTEAKHGRSNPNIPSGIVPGVRRPAGMVPLKVVPEKQKRPIPFYARLRAEVDRPFLTRGEGKLYLGFHLDPLYAVHWNNRVKPLEFRLETAEGVRVTPSRGSGPKVKQPADKDPREFLLDIATDGQSPVLAPFRAATSPAMTPTPSAFRSRRGTRCTWSRPPGEGSPVKAPDRSHLDGESPTDALGKALNR